MDGAVAVRPAGRRASRGNIAGADHPDSRGDRAGGRRRHHGGHRHRPDARGGAPRRRRFPLRRLSAGAGPAAGGAAGRRLLADGAAAGTGRALQVDRHAAADAAGAAGARW
ncbi:hypothetical protein MY55_04780 [Chromobacterium subtsugae]|nr:hypothetical protein MY55_04780 [Chromobacterium subtsugae]